MTIARRVFGVVLWAFCLGLLIYSLKPLMFQLRQTADLKTAVSDPVYFLPLTAASLGIVGGVIILAGGPAGAFLGCMGAVIYTLYALGVLAFVGDESMWFPKFVGAAIILVLSLGALRLPRRLE